MKKKIVSAALATVLAAALSVSVLANPTIAGVETGGGDQTIQGEGYVGFGSVIPDEDKSEAPGINAIDEGDETLTGTGITGSTIFVTWPDGTVESVTVASDGSWSIATPGNGSVLVEGDRINAYQVEVDKEKSDNVYVIVGSGEGGIVEPEIPIRAEDYLNVTIPAKFFWWVIPEENEQGGVEFGAVNSAEHYIRNNGFEFELNGSNAFFEFDVDVTLKSFAQTDGTQLDGLSLHLTGDLAGDTVDGFAVGDINLAQNAFSNSSAYAAPLKYTNTALGNDAATVWSFGFGGSYTGTIPTQAKQPKYEMTLHFTTDVEVDPSEITG